MLKTARNHKILLTVLFVVSTVLIFLGVYRNQWQAINTKKFNSFQRDVESYVLARMVIARQEGLLAYGGLIGWGDVDIYNVRENDYDHQYDTYLQNQTFQTYWAKRSHPSFQAIFFSVLDLFNPLPPTPSFRLYHALTSALLALTLAGIIAWFYLEFGLLSALMVLGSLMVSPWLTLFGRNLFFFTWAFYLPMLVLLFWFRGEKSESPYTHRQLFGLVFGLILFKCLFNGYDFILPALGMAATPLVFYALRQRWDKYYFARRLLVMMAASLLAILVSFLVLSVQVAVATGDLRLGVDAITSTIFLRTYSLNASPIPNNPADAVSVGYILEIYLDESYLHHISLPISWLIGLFAGTSLAYWALRKHLAESIIPGDAFVLTTWFALLSPLSWYIIFKTLAYYHTHMNHLPWLMPFTLFGFGMCGFVLETCLNALKKQFPSRTLL